MPEGATVDIIAREIIAQIVEVGFPDQREFYEDVLDEDTWTEVEAQILVLIDALRGGVI
jgi:hypothetical protein